MFPNNKTSPELEPVNDGAGGSPVTPRGLTNDRKFVGVIIALIIVAVVAAFIL